MSSAMLTSAALTSSSPLIGHRRRGGAKSGCSGEARQRLRIRAAAAAKPTSASAASSNADARVSGGELSRRGVLSSAAAAAAAARIQKMRPGLETKPR
mmetsp:Transcript_3371/g.7898  ORF Transcript_3371/g.7898 Transcript_3371/m.7898 type:complete len:98 (-) Transcript_3371:245-538(-)